MIYSKNKIGSVLIYTLVLVNIALIMAMVVVSNTFILESSYTFNNTNKLLQKGIVTHGNLATKYSNYLNSNGNGFVDTIGCPSSITMSGNTNLSTISSFISYTSGTIICKGIYNSKILSIYYNSGFTAFEKANYDGSDILLFSHSGTFNDSDSTHIDFSSYVNTPDNIDDDFNSDNYLANSTGSFSYPDGYSDDDILSRTTLYGYISPDVGMQNIFWSNTKIRDYINNNPNNNDPLHEKLGYHTGVLYLDTDSEFKIRLVKFDKDMYDSNEELVVLEDGESLVSSGGIGYIQDNLTLSGNITGNEYNFDLINYDYAVFLESTGTGVLFYSLLGETLDGTGMYINPIDDTHNSVIRTLGYNILKVNGKYIGKMLEVIGKKE